MSQDLNCPKCGMKDATQKVSSVYQGGISEVRTAGPSGGIGFGGNGKPVFVGGITTLSGYSQTSLSQCLTPPTKPSQSGCAIVCLVIGIGLLCLAGLLACWGLAVGKTWNASAAQNSAFGFQLMFIVGIIGAIPTVVGASLVKQDQAKFAVELPRWEKAINRWQQLYYCHRDDGVFLPGESGLVPIAKFSDLLYR